MLLMKLESELVELSIVGELELKSTKTFGIRMSNFETCENQELESDSEKLDPEKTVSGSWSDSNSFQQCCAGIVFGVGVGSSWKVGVQVGILN